MKFPHFYQKIYYLNIIVFIVRWENFLMMLKNKFNICYFCQAPLLSVPDLVPLLTWPVWRLSRSWIWIKLMRFFLTDSNFHKIFHFVTSAAWWAQALLRSIGVPSPCQMIKTYWSKKLYKRHIIVDFLWIFRNKFLPGCLCWWC